VAPLTGVVQAQLVAWVDVRQAVRLGVQRQRRVNDGDPWVAVVPVAQPRGVRLAGR
jgi:hypothetical protein